MARQLPSHDLAPLDCDRPTILNNRTCIYCGVELNAKADRTREHAIGRNFVPKGALDRQWNLIARACRNCNAGKAELEDDLSAISMQRRFTEPLSDDDKELLAESRRKARGAVSRRTRKTVQDSQERFQIDLAMGAGVTFKFDFTGPPQADPKRIYRLAMLHIQACFYLITYKPDLRSGARFPGVFAPVMDVIRSDWGNAVMRGFMSATRLWDRRVLLIGACECFKLSIRRHPENAEIWAWAVEWNRNLRAIGFFGNKALIPAAVSNLPPLKAETIAEGNGDWIRCRIEEPLPDHEDHLFIDDDVSTFVLHPGSSERTGMG